MRIHKAILCLTFATLGLAHGLLAFQAEPTRQRGPAPVNLRPANLQSWSFTGTLRAEFRKGELDSQTERIDVRALMPDHFLRIDTSRNVAIWNGFAGDQPLSTIVPQRPHVDVKVSGASSGYAERQREVAGRLMVGLFGFQGFSDSSELHMHQAGNRLIGDGGNELVVDLDRATRLPTRMKYVNEWYFSDAVEARMSRPRNGLKEGSYDFTVELKDRHRLEGVLIPALIVTTVRGVTVEEIRIETFHMNPSLSAADFRRPPGPAR